MVAYTKLKEPLKKKEKEGHLKTKTIKFGFDKGYIKKKAKTQEITEVKPKKKKITLPKPTDFGAFKKKQKTTGYITKKDYANK